MASRVPFRQIDVTRAIRGAMSAGMKPTRAEIVDGKIVLSFVDRAEPMSALDEWKAKRDARPA